MNITPRQAHYIVLALMAWHEYRRVQQGGHSNLTWEQWSQLCDDYLKEAGLCTYDELHKLAERFDAARQPRAFDPALCVGEPT